MLFLLLFLLAAQSPAPPRSADELKARLCPPMETHLLDADEKKIVVAIAEHYRKYEWSRDKGFVEASVGRHAVASLKSPSVFVDRSVPVAEPFAHGISVKLESHGVPPDLAKELITAARTANASYKTFDTTNLPLVPFHCDDFASLLMRASPAAGRDMTNAGTAISMSVPALDSTRTHALVLSLNDLEWLLGHGVREMELSLLTKSHGEWVVTWHSLIGDWASERKTHPTPVTPDDHGVFDAMLERIVAARVGRGQCIRVVNESNTHGGEEIAMESTWTKRGGDAAEAFHDMAGRSAEYIGGYKPRPRVEFVSDDVREESRAKPFGSCGGYARLTLPGFSKDQNTALALYTVGFSTSEGTEWGTGTMLLRRKGKAWEITEDDYQRGMVELKRPMPASK